MHGVLQPALPDGGGADNKGAIGYGIGDGVILRGVCKDVRCGTDCGPGLPKRRLKRIDHPQVHDTEITHGTGGSSKIERVARGHQNNAQAIEFRGSWQG